MRGSAAGLQRLTVSEWLAGTLADPGARAAAGALVRVSTFVADHDTLSADVAARQIRLALVPGVRYVRGGWSRIVEALETQAIGRGVTICTRARVQAVQLAPGGGWTVALESDWLNADLVIGGRRRARRLRRTAGGARPRRPPGPAGEVSALDLGLRSLPEPGATFGLGVDVPDYISRHSPAGPARRRPDEPAALRPRPPVRTGPLRRCGPARLAVTAELRALPSADGRGLRDADAGHRWGWRAGPAPNVAMGCSWPAIGSGRTAGCWMRALGQRTPGRAGCGRGGPGDRLEAGARPGSPARERRRVRRMPAAAAGDRLRHHRRARRGRGRRPGRVAALGRRRLRGGG